MGRRSAVPKSKLPPPPEREEWDFESVPEAQLEACALWEYARESEWMRGLKRRCEEPHVWLMAHSDMHKFVGEDIERVQADWRASRVLAWRLFSGNPMPEELPDGSSTTRRVDPDLLRFPCVWQKLNEAERRRRATIPSLKTALCAAPFQRGHPGDCKWLVEFGESYMARGSPPQETRPGWQPGQSFCTAGAEHGVFEVGWDCFTNDEIVKCFAAWVKSNRPSDLPGPDGRGRRKHDWRVQLKRLGIMRLLHRCPLPLVKEWCPAAWKRYGRLDWYKERRRALNHFRQLLWMLPAGQEPLSWPTPAGEGKEGRH